MTLLDKAAILAADDLVTEDIEVPEWGGRIRVRSLTGAERDAYDAESWRRSQNPNSSALDDFRVRRIAKAIVGEDGKRLFTDSEIALLGKKNGAVLDRIDDVVVRLSGLSGETRTNALADLKDDPSGGSGSD